MLINAWSWGGAPERRTIETIRRWGPRRVVMPAMLLAWGTRHHARGQGRLVPAAPPPWLSTKLVFVLGAVGAAWRAVGRAAPDAGADPDKRPPAFLRFSAPLTIVAVLVVVTLAGDQAVSSGPSHRRGRRR